MRGRRDGAFEVHYSSRITDIGRDAWYALSSGDPAADYDWQRTMRAAGSSRAEEYFWWVMDERGLVAVVMGSILTPESRSTGLDRQRYGPLGLAIGPLRRFFQPRPTLVCGAHFAPGNPLLVREGLSPEDRLDVAECLVESVEAHCRARRLNLYYYSVLETDNALGSLFAMRPYLRAPSPPNTVLEIRWNSWREYLKDLKVNHPSTEKSIRAQVNRGHRHGVVIEEVKDPAPYESEIHRILTEHYLRKNRSDLALSPKFPTLLKDQLGDRALIYVAKMNDRLIGVSIYIRNQAAWHWKYFGIDKDHVRSPSAVYFNLAFHHPVRQACQTGCERIIMGTVPYRVKLSRGGRLIRVSNWAWQPNRLRGLLQRPLLSYAHRRQERNLARFSS